MKITIIANDDDILKAIKAVKFPFIKKHSLFRILSQAITAYENKKEGQSIRATSTDPKIELIISDD